MAAAPALALADRGRASTPPELDRETLASCARGDPVALRRFVVRYQPLVFAYLSRSLGHGVHVEDTAQEVFLRAFKALPGFDVRGPGRPSTWLLTIAAHLVVDTRKRRREALVGEPAIPIVADLRTPETERHRADIGGALAKAAGQLPDEQRDAFILAEFHHLSMAEMAEVAGVPVGTMKARLSRARERLRTLLGDLWEQEL